MPIHDRYVIQWLIVGARVPVDRGFSIIRSQLTASVTEFDQHGFDANRAASRAVIRYDDSSKVRKYFVEGFIDSPYLPL